MRSGVYLEDFEKSVLETFGFLLTEEHFDTYRSEKTQYVLDVDFIRKGMLVRIEYSLRNDTIDVQWFRSPETIPTRPMNYDESSSLGILLKYDRFPFSELDSMMPYHSRGIEASLQLLAAAFRKHVSGIIHGEEWISVNMVRSGERRTPGPAQQGNG